MNVSAQPTNSKESADECAPASRVPAGDVASVSTVEAAITYDPVDPPHYKLLKPEPRDVIRAWGLNFNRGCIVKYVARAGVKDPAKEVEDLRKARSYIDHEIATLTGETRAAAPFDLSDVDGAEPRSSFVVNADGGVDEVLR